MTDTALYYRYWGKADEPLKAAYCSGRAKDEIVAQFKTQLARLLHIPESGIKVAHPDQWAREEDKTPSIYGFASVNTGLFAALMMPCFM